MIDNYPAVGPYCFCLKSIGRELNDALGYRRWLCLGKVATSGYDLPEQPVEHFYSQGTKPWLIDTPILFVRLKWKR
ncbi:hypothetical protein N8843_04370 [Verrucomicrobia bacterium]|nr:hypothetical protein [Verrucomicrobiota bacterium]MDA7627853.1 hypothetical protein [Verrucomicrobiota bacterium]